MDGRVFQVSKEITSPAMSLPSTMRAIKIVGKEKAEIQEAPLPQLRDGWVLIKTTHVALNPTDWKHIDFMPYPGATVGVDFAGVIVAFGPNCNRPLAVGDRVAGAVHGCNVLSLEEGAYGEYTIAKEGGLLRLPNTLASENGATLVAGLATVALSLYQELSLPWPGSVQAGPTVLVYGASSATGTLAVQFAKMSGSTVVAASSAKNFDLVKSRGADAVFDYNDPDCGDKIRAYTKDSLYNILDCIGGEQGIKICSEALSSRGGQICAIADRPSYPRTDARVKHVMGYTIQGDPCQLGENYVPAIPESEELGRVFFGLADRLLAEGKIIPHPARVGKGLEGVLEGLDELRNGKVSGVKLVYEV